MAYCVILRELVPHLMSDDSCTHPKPWYVMPASDLRDLIGSTGQCLDPAGRQFERGDFGVRIQGISGQSVDR